MGNNSINDELVAANLKRIRKQQKVTQRQLGERTGKSERTIQNYESGKINFNLDSCICIRN
jgi:transcriptional regulator with XRE-family HTH domain